MRVKLRVYNTSGPAWQPIKNGQPYNKWVGTIDFTEEHRVRFSGHYQMVVASTDKDKVYEMLERFHLGEVVSVPEERLIKPYRG